MIYVYSDKITNRLKYVLDFCFSEKYEEYEIITDVADWNGLQGQRLNYSGHELVANKKIEPSGILVEDGFDKKYELTFSHDKFLLNGQDDPLAIIFFLITRYEEYQSYETDSHDRYLAAQHSLVRLNQHRKPVADELNKQLWHDLALDYSFVQSRYEIVPSFDIDVAYAYKNRTAVRQIGAMVKHGKIGERLRVLLRKKKDPYDTYSEIHHISAKVNRIICFALLGDWGEFDKNLSHKNYNLGSTLRGLNAVGGMGIHPSYKSYLDKNQIKKEIGRLEEIVGHEIKKSRQHYLKLRIPDSYEILDELGVNRDYSMGFSDEVGFRAGTSFPHFFFNLKTNEQTKLLVFPYAYMDGSFRQYLKQTPEESIQIIDDLIASVKDVGGVFMCVWHNSSINNWGEWKGWKKVFDHTIEKGISK